jgi:hypothetical protein
MAGTPAAPTCRNCGGPLDAVAADGFCPRCGYPASASRRDDLLCDSDRTWVAVVRRGVHVQFWLIASMPLWIIVFGVTQQIFGRFAEAGLYLFGLIGYWATYRTLTPEPGRVPRTAEGVRSISISLLAISAAGVAFSIVATLAALSDPKLVVLVAIVELVFGVFGAVLTGTELTYLGELSRRVPDYPMSKRATWMAYVLGMTSGLLAFVQFVGEAVGAADPRRGEGIAGCGMLLMFVPLVVLVVLLARWLWRFQRHLGRAASGRP